MTGTGAEELEALSLAIFCGGLDALKGFFVYRLLILGISLNLDGRFAMDSTTIC